MYAPVRHQTSCVIPEPTEREMKTVPVERTFRGRPQPHIIVHSGGHRLVRLDGDRGAPTLIREYTYGADLTLSKLADDDEKLVSWYKEKGLTKKGYLNAA